MSYSNIILNNVQIIHIRGGGGKKIFTTVTTCIGHYSRPEGNRERLGFLIKLNYIQTFITGFIKHQNLSTCSLPTLYVLRPCWSLRLIMVSFNVEDALKNPGHGVFLA